MQRNTSVGSHDLAPANSRRALPAPPLPIVEFAALICTGTKSAFWAASAAETRHVRWKGSLVQRKGSSVQWKATPGAVESWSSQKRLMLLALSN
jgi:uncharacterized membrane protein